MASDTLLTTSKQVMAIPLPYLYEETAKAAGGEAKALEPIGGSDFAGDIIAKANMSNNQRMESEVLTPIKRWLDALASLKLRKKELDRMRVELDATRRHRAETAASVDKQRGKMTRVQGGGKTEAKLEERVKKLQEREAKEKVSSANFEEHEEALYRDLAALIRDGGWLKHYVAAALVVEKETLDTAITGFGEVKVIPRATTPASTPTTPTVEVERASTASPSPTPTKQLYAPMGPTPTVTAV